MADKRRVYLDSCCFIDAVKFAVSASLETDRKVDVWHVKQLLQAHRDKEIQVLVSTLAIAECTTIDSENEVPDSVKREFASLLMSGEYVHLIEPTPFIMEDARDLRWVHRLRLRGADAVHVASAIERSCEEFITTDRRILNANSQLEALGIKAIAAHDSACLPEKYRQVGMDV